MNFAQALEIKRNQLARMQSSIPAVAGGQTAHSRGIQADTPQPLAAYPNPGAAPVVILNYTAPPRMSGALTGLAIVHLGAPGSFADGSGNVVWRVLVNGAPVKGLEAIYAQIGSISQLAPMYLLLREGDHVQVTVQVPAGKVAPAGNPFARIAGHLDFGGLGSFAPRATPRAPGSPAAGATGTSTGWSTSTGWTSTGFGLPRTGWTGGLI